MPDEELLLQAVIDRPHDDAPRLVYADWLEEQGDPARAEFIRVQCELARTPDDAPRAEALRERERALLNDHQLAWAEPLLSAGAVYWGYRRGFLAWATLTTRAFVRHGEELLRRSPVRELRLLDARGELATLAACPPLAAVHTLDLSHAKLVDEDLATLAGCPHLTGLATLDLGGNTITATAVAILSRAPALTRLTRLDLGNNPIGVGGVVALVRSRLLRRLRRLGLRRCAIDDGVAAALAAGPPLALKRLDLACNPALGPAGVQALTSSASLPHLKDLRLEDTASGDAGAAALAASALLAQLRRLDLGASSQQAVAPVTAAGVQAVLSSPHLRHVKELHVAGARRRHRDPVVQPGQRPAAAGAFRLTVTTLDDLFGWVRGAALPPGLATLRLTVFGPAADQAALAAWPALSTLARLEIRDATVSPEFATALAANGRRLRALRLPADGLGEAGARALLASADAGGLEEITLDVRRPHPLSPPPLDAVRAVRATDRVRVCGADPDALLGRDDWPLPWRQWLAGPRLQSLLVTHERTDLGDAAVEELARLPLLERLVALDLFCVRIGPAGARALAASPHVRNLRYLRLSFSPIGDAGAAAVAASPHLANLRTLKLSFCGIGDAGVEALAASRHVTRLTTLKLWGDETNPIGDAGARAIAHSLTLAGLVKLRLSSNAIGDAGALALAESPYLRYMLDLSLSGNPISPPVWRRLEERFGRRLGLAMGEWDRLD